MQIGQSLGRKAEVRAVSVQRQEQGPAPAQAQRASPYLEHFPADVADLEFRQGACHCRGHPGTVLGAGRTPGHHPHQLRGYHAGRGELGWDRWEEEAERQSATERQRCENQRFIQRDYLLHVYCVPATVAGSGDTAVDKRGREPCPCGENFLEQEMDGR